MMGTVESRMEALEERVTSLEAAIREMQQPPEPDPLAVGTALFRQTAKVKKASLQRRA